MEQREINTLKRTILHPQHVAFGAKMVPFGGWEMPLYYHSAVEEHMTVRQAAGVFDVSHMGRISVDGPKAEAFLDYMCTNIIAGKADGSTIYTVLCNEQGTCIDDVIVLRHSSQSFSVISNASNRDKVYFHLLNYAKLWGVEVKDSYQNEFILALQGPKSMDIATQLFPETAALKPHQCATIGENIVSTTGYTGELGCEIIGPLPHCIDQWNKILELGKSFGMKPVGLGSRDSLRLEMGYALYGHELSELIAPIESVSYWTVKMKKHEFLGKNALTTLENSPNRRYQCGVLLQEGGVPREGCHVYREGKMIGILTSGGFSPVLKKGIAIAMVHEKLEAEAPVEIMIRERAVKAKVAALPFIQRRPV